MHRATRVRLPLWKNWQIGWFIRRYGVNMSEAATSETSLYPDFNTFFTRPLRPGARPLDGDTRAVSSPADGEVSQFGSIRDGAMVQAKGHTFTVRALLGALEDAAPSFTDGSFATIYLAPRDYHRVHMPLSGKLREMAYVPGRLFSVNPTTTRLVPRLFTRNDRVVSLFDTEVGPLAMVLVGAVFVGSIEQVWSGTVTAGTMSGRRARRYDDGPPIEIERGAEMGRFNMGSTVIMLVGSRSLRWRDGLAAGMPVRQGEALAAV